MKNRIPYGLSIIAMKKNESNIYLGTEQYGVFKEIAAPNGVLYALQ